MSLLVTSVSSHCVFFFQAEDGIRDLTVTGVQTCALPILPLCGEQTHARAHTRHVRTAPRAAGNREDAIEHLHGFIPCQIVAAYQEVATVGTGQEFRLIDNTLLGV